MEHHTVRHMDKMIHRIVATCHVCGYTISTAAVHTHSAMAELMAGKELYGQYKAHLIGEHEQGLK